MLLVRVTPDLNIIHVQVNFVHCYKRQHWLSLSGCFLGVCASDKNPSHDILLHTERPQQCHRMLPSVPLWQSRRFANAWSRNYDNTEVDIRTTHLTDYEGIFKFHWQQNYTGLNSSQYKWIVDN